MCTCVCMCDVCVGCYHARHHAPNHAPCTIHCSKVDVIEVVWPDGACAVLSASVTIDTLHTVAYPVGSGDNAAACSNVTSANGGAARLLLVMHSCSALHNAN